MPVADGRKSNEKTKKVVVERSSGCSIDAPAVFSFTLTGFLALEPFECDGRGRLPPRPLSTTRSESKNAGIHYAESS